MGLRDTFSYRDQRIIIRKYMKRIIFSFLVTLIGLTAMADDVIGTKYTIKVNAANGTFYSKGTETGQTWNNLWTSTSTAPALRLSTAANNMSKQTDADITLASGAAQTSTYTLWVSGNYRITGYSFIGKAGNGKQTFTSADGGSLDFRASANVDIQLSGMSVRSTTFTISGDNVGITGVLTVNVVRADFAPDVTVVQGYQTAGRGSRAVLLCARFGGEADNPYRIDNLGVTLKDNTAALIDRLEVYTTEQPELLSDAAAKPIATAAPAGDVSIDLKDLDIKTAGVHYLWITASVKADAAVGDSLDALLETVSYTYKGQSYTVTLHDDPEGVAIVFACQSFPFVPTTYGSRYYRIPAMIVAGDGSIVVACDKRYDSDGDLGDHKIDVVCRRSADNGRTWSKPQIIAAGDGQTDDKYGYGDPALAKAPNGDLVCVFAASKNVYWKGITHIGITISKDNGKTWSPVRDLTASRFKDEVGGARGKFGSRSIFVSSGRGITTKAGEIMFLANVLTSPDNNVVGNYILKSADNGLSWTLCKEEVYHGGDEAKLAELPDGSLLASVRQNGARGFNLGDATGKKWQKQSRSTTLSGNACNADILSYSDRLLLHSILSNTGSRRDIRIYGSTDQGKTWAEAERVQSGYAGYSTMEKLPSGDVALLFEDGSYGDNGYTITFVTIPAERVNAYLSAAGGAM